MADSSKDKVLKAIAGLLSQDLLGLQIHSELETSHNSQFTWSGVADLFRHKAHESPYYDSLCAAFTKVHDHKYIDNPVFCLAMDKEMSAMGLPTPVREEGLKYVEEILSEYSSKPLEQDAGWNSHISDLRDVTSHAHDRTPEDSKPFTGGGPIPESQERKKKR